MRARKGPSPKPKTKSQNPKICVPVCLPHPSLPRLGEQLGYSSPAWAAQVVSEGLVLGSQDDAEASAPPGSLQPRVVGNSRDIPRETGAPQGGGSGQELSNLSLYFSSHHLRCDKMQIQSPSNWGKPIAHRAWARAAPKAALRLCCPHSTGMGMGWQSQGTGILFGSGIYTGAAGSSAGDGNFCCREGGGCACQSTECPGQEGLSRRTSWLSSPSSSLSLPLCLQQNLGQRLCNRDRHSSPHSSERAGCSPGGTGMTPQPAARGCWQPETSLPLGPLQWTLSTETLGLG